MDDTATPSEPPTRDRSLDEINAEYDRVHAEVGRLLDRLGTLAAERAAVLADTGAHLDGPDLAAAAFVLPEALARLRAKAKALHPRIIDLQRYTADVSGMTPAWAPVVLSHRHDGTGDLAALVAAMRHWTRTFEPTNPIGSADKASARRWGHTLIDIRGTSVQSRRRGQVWVRRDADEAFLVDVDSQLLRHEVEGTLLEVLTAAAGLYFAED